MCQIKMASLNPRFQSLMHSLSKITVIQIIIFKKKTLPDEEDFAILYICYLQVCILMRTF